MNNPIVLQLLNSYVAIISENSMRIEILIILIALNSTFHIVKFIVELFFITIKLLVCLVLIKLQK